MGLWTDPEQANGSTYEWLHRPAQLPQPPAPPPPQAPAPPPQRSPKRLIAAIVAGVVAISLLTSLLVVKLTDGSGPNEKAVAPIAVSKGAVDSSNIKQIYDRVSDSVVSIQVATGGGNGATGSGFIIAGDGTIVTNDHVVEDATEVQVRFDDNGQNVPAKVIGTDPSSDLAVLQVDPSRAPKLKPLTLADSSTVSVGDQAIAIGFPLGLDRTATAGIVSGLHRTIQAPNNYSISDVIQTDAPINPGNSGGPLLDSRGRVIGVNSQIATAGSQGSVGIGFAVPSNTVRDVVPRLKRGQSIRRAYLGVSTTPPLNRQGAAIAEIRPGGPAEKADLRSGSSITGLGGDVITSINGDTVASPDQLTQLVGALKPGDTATLGIERDGHHETVKVVLGERPGTPSGP